MNLSLLQLCEISILIRQIVLGEERVSESEETLLRLYN